MNKNRQKGTLLLSAFMVFGAMATYAQSPGGIPVASWWRADAATTVFSDAGTTPSTDSSALYQWNDYTGHGYNFIQATAGNRPVYSNTRNMANFNPTITFTSDYMDYTPAAGTKIISRANGALYAAGYMNTVGNTGFFGFDASNDFPGLHTYPVSGKYKLLFFTNGGPGYQGLSDSAFQAKTYFTAGAWWQNAAGGTTAYAKAKVSLNGNRVVYSGNQIYNVDTNTAYDDMRLGWDSNWGALNGELNELMIFEDTLSSGQMDQVETYLAIKYGSTYAYGERNYKSSAGTAVWTAAVNAGNNQNIAGIARDNNGALYQKQSWSTNPGQQVLIGTTGLANTNAANTGSLTNGQYLVWGDNGLEKAPTVSTSSIAGANFRFASVWKVQNTGAVGTVRVAWPQNTAYQSFRLVRSTDSTFATGNTVTDMTGNTQTVNGVVYNYADVTLADGQYFTFAVNLPTPGGVSLPAVWYKPNGVTNSGWADASVNGMDLTNQSTTGDTMVMAGNQAHNFHSWTTGYSSNNYYNYIDSSAASTNLEDNPVFGNYNSDGLSYMPISIFGAARPTASDNGLITGIDNESSTAAEPGLAVYPVSGSVSPRFYRFSNGIDRIATTKTGGLNQTSIFYAHPYPGDATSANGNLVIGLNGVDTVIANQNGRSSVAGPYLKIGYSSFGFGAFQGDIQEVIWYKTSLTQIQKEKVETYLSLKFGTTLAHNYVNAAGDTVFDISTNSGYANNIAGIGKEANNGNLNQKQSNSVNTGNQLIVSTTGLANTNDANTTSLNEGQFLVWGDNGLAKSASIYTGNTFSNVNVRFKAIWRAQNTGSVGTVRVAWPAGLSNLTLIQSADTTFNASDVLTPMTQTQTINGVDYNYADVALANGQYFTLAAKILHAPGGVFNGLAQWFRADKQTSVGANDTLTSWADYAMNIEASRISTAALPLLHSGDATYLNFNPGVNFTAINQKIGNLSIQTIASRNYDIFSLTKEGIAGGRFYNVGRNNTTMDGSNWDSPGLYANSGVARRDSVGNLKINGGVGTGSFLSNTPSATYYSFTNTTALDAINGSPLPTAVTTAALGLPKGGFIFGDNTGVGTSGDDGGIVGNIGDLIVYNTNLTTNERNRVDAYLAIKYGITLDTASSYLTSASTVVWDKNADRSFYHNVAGIGRDDVSDLYQKQSRSQITNNVDSQVTIAVDSIYATNVANPGAIADQQFLVWGDNGNTQAMTNTASTYTTFAFNGSSDNRRMNRVWKVRNTDVANQVTIRFPQASVGTTTIPGETAAAGYAIIFASDSAMTTGITVLPLTGNGTNYDVTTTFPDGVSYFTFGKIMDTALPPATCTPDIYLAQDNPTTLRNVDVSTNPFVYTIVGAATPGIDYNAIGVNPKDGYVYGMLNNSRTLIRINPENGNLTTLGTITGLPTGTSFNSGEIDSAGNYYVKALGSTNTLYKVDVNTMAVTTINMSASITVSDIAYNVTDQLIYTVNSNGRLYTIDPVSGTTTAIGVSSGSAVLGAMYGSGDGNIYGVDNSGGFYQFNKTTGQKVLLSSSPSSGNNDGARCVNAILTLPSDLYVTKTTTNTNYTPGDTVVYTVVAGNNGPFGVMNAILRDSVPAGIPDSNVSYTAVASSGSSTTVSGTMMGNIADTFSIPKNGTITYTVSIVIPAGFTGNLVNTASVVAPDNINDTTVGNNATTVTLGSSLPVTLLDFNAEKVNHEVQLSWMTTNELNSKGFEVERSTDATDWKAIGFVASKADNGNSKLQLSYLFNDIHPENNKNFYRLKEVDINGNYSYSEIRMVNFTDGSSIQIHPNPVLENVTISGLTGNRQIVVTNVLGQVVLRAQTNGEATKELHTADLTPGTYFITISNEQNENLTFKMIKE